MYRHLIYESEPDEEMCNPARGSEHWMPPSSTYRVFLHVRLSVAMQEGGRTVAFSRDRGVDQYMNLIPEAVE